MVIGRAKAAQPALVKAMRFFKEKFLPENLPGARAGERGSPGFDQWLWMCRHAHQWLHAFKATSKERSAISSPLQALTTTSTSSPSTTVLSYPSATATLQSRCRGPSRRHLRRPSLGQSGLLAGWLMRWTSE